jgi:hypothetical protein
MVTLILRCSAPSFYPDHGRGYQAEIYKFYNRKDDAVFSMDRSARIDGVHGHKLTRQSVSGKGRDSACATCLR